MTTETTDLTTKTTTDLTESTDTLVTLWLEFERSEGASDATLTAYRRGIEVYQTWLQANNATPGTVTPQTVRQFKVDLAEQVNAHNRKNSAQTVNLRLSAVRSFYRFLVTTDRIPVNPAGEVKGVKRPKSRTHKRDELSNGEVKSVIDTCDPLTLDGMRDWAILTLMSYCGVRQIEINRADIGDLRTRGDRLTLDVQGKGRTEKDEFVVIPRDKEQAVRLWVKYRMSARFDTHDDGDPLFVSLSNRSHGQRLALRSIRNMVKARYKKAGVIGKGKTTHSLRHSAITNAIRQGATPMQVQAMARHSSFDTTLGYYHEVSRVDNPAEDLISYDNGGDQ